MQRYVQQLVDQMRASAKTRLDARAAALRHESDRERFEVTPDGISEDESSAAEDAASFSEHIADVEAYIEGPSAHAPSLAELSGVPLAELPVADALTQEETLALVNAIKALVQTYGHTLDIEPRPGCPASVVYAYVLEELESPAQEYPGGGVHHGCCEAPAECVFGRWCTCTEYITHERFLEEGGAPEIPPYLFKSEAEVEREHAAFEAFRARPRTDDVPYQLGMLTSRDYEPAPVRPPLQDLQATVDDWIATTGIRYFSKLTNTAILAEEVGELARLSARIYGEQSFKREADAASAKTDWADELSDILFVLTCLANQTGVDLTEAFAKGMKKRTRRDATRHAGNEKLRG